MEREAGAGREDTDKNRVEQGAGDNRTEPLRFVALLVFDASFYFRCPGLQSAG